MPMWQIFYPKDAYTDEDKQVLSERITAIYAQIPIPEFYVVVIFHEVAPTSFYVGGKSRSNFVRFKVDQMARTLPGDVFKEWWMRRVEEIVAPFVTERGYDSEVQIDEPGRELWTMNGTAPPPFESVAEKRWVEANRVLPFTSDEMMPARLQTTWAEAKKTHHTGEEAASTKS